MITNHHHITKEWHLLLDPVLNRYWSNILSARSDDHRYDTLQIQL